MNSVRSSIKPAEEGNHTEAHEEIANRSGRLWKCLARETFGQGYLYLFRLDEYDELAAEAKQKEIFPAVERTGRGLLEALQMNELAALGILTAHRDDGIYVSLPDKDALLSRWKLIRAKKPKLPALKIVESKGVASDAEFIEAFLNCDALLSTGVEFFHDELTHLLPKLHILLFDAPRYNEDQAFMRAIIAKQYQRLNLAKEALLAAHIDEKRRADLLLKWQQLLAALSAFIDSIPNGGAGEEAREYVAEIETLGFENMWTLPSWKEYGEKRFGKIDVKELTSLWKKVVLLDLSTDRVKFIEALN